MAEHVSLDSTYLLAFEMAHTALRDGLKSSSPLNITQYRVLTKLFQAGEACNQGYLGQYLDLRPNVITQAVDVLQRHGFVVRSAGSDDARTRYVAIAKPGCQHIAAMDPVLIESLYRIFPSKNPAYRSILEAAAITAASIEPPLDEGRPPKYPATRALMAVELIRQDIERTLRAVSGVSYNECRLLQRLAEVDVPVRLGVLSSGLAISAASVGRCVDQLARRGWVQRLCSPDDRKAVYVALTDEGQFQGHLIRSTADEWADSHLWSRLSGEHQAAMAQVGTIVTGDLQAQRKAEERDVLQHLIPAASVASHIRG